MDTYSAEAIRQILEALSPELYFLLWKAMLGIVIFNVIVSLCRNVALYIRIRMSNHISTRTMIIYDGFEGVIEEISVSGIFIRNADGVVKFVPIAKWYEGDIQYPNVLGEHKHD